MKNRVFEKERFSMVYNVQALEDIFKDMFKDEFGKDLMMCDVQKPKYAITDSRIIMYIHY